MRRHPRIEDATSLLEGEALRAHQLRLAVVGVAVAGRLPDDVGAWFVAEGPVSPLSSWDAGAQEKQVKLMAPPSMHARKTTARIQGPCGLVLPVFKCVDEIVHGLGLAKYLAR